MTQRGFEMECRLDINVTQNGEYMEAYEFVDCSNLEQIGKGVTALAYKLDESRMIKIYKEGITLEQIENERSITQKICDYGVNTPMCYGTVRTNLGYGNIYRYLSGGTFTDHLLSSSRDSLNRWVIEYAKLAKSLNEKNAGDDLADYHTILEGHLEISRDLLSEDVIAEIERVLNAIPNSDNLLHGDMSTGNIMVERDQLFFVDLATVGKGHPIIDLSVPYMVTVMWPRFSEMARNMPEMEREKRKDWFGYLNRYTEKSLPGEEGQLAWKLFLKTYFGLASPEDDLIERLTDIIRYFSMAKYCLCGFFKRVYSRDLLDEMVNFYSSQLMSCKKPDMELLKDDKWNLQKA